MYRHRILEKKIKDYLKNFPVVGITGPRQSGKSTLLKHLLADRYTYVTFDDYNTKIFFEEDPERFIQTYSKHVIFDEAQQVPQLFPLIKSVVDRNRSVYGQFILTGSSQFNLVAKITESLAGRIGLLSLMPFQYSELPLHARDHAQLYGSYPELAMRKFRLSRDWYSSYLETYIDKDVRQLHNVGDIRDFHRFIQLLASRCGQLLNMANISSDLGISIPTVKRWLSILEASFIIYLLPPYYKNLGKRLVRTPKIYFIDNGLVCYLTGIDTLSQLLKGPMAGALFENYVITEVIKREWHIKSGANLCFYRTSNGDEIDLIIEQGHRVTAIEIKNSSTFKPQFLTTLRNFLGESDKGVLIYNGASMPYADPRIEIVPAKKYLL